MPISSRRKAVEGGMRESVMMWSTSSISAILLKPLRPNLEESASTIVLGSLHHYAVEARFHHIGSGDAEVEVDAVYADKQLAARKSANMFSAYFPTTDRLLCRNMPPS